MSVPASHCEAKLHGFRRTQDGVVVSFVLHPAEVPKALALDPLGTRYMLALAQIGDDEQPTSQLAAPAAETPRPEFPHDLPAGASLSAERCPQHPWSSCRVDGSIVCAMPGCGWKLKPSRPSASERGKERYASSTPMAQAVMRAAVLAKDSRFREWAAGDECLTPLSVDEAIAYIQQECCEGRSRGLIGEDPDCYARYIAMESSYKIAIGEIAEPR